MSGEIAGQGKGGLLLWHFDCGTFEWLLARQLPPGFEGPRPAPIAGLDSETIMRVPGHLRQQFSLDSAMLPARAFDGRPGHWRTMTCPVCWRVSTHPQDAAERYCGACEWWTGDPELARFGTRSPRRSPWDPPKVCDCHPQRPAELPTGLGLTVRVHDIGCVLRYGPSPTWTGIA